MERVNESLELWMYCTICSAPMWEGDVIIVSWLCEGYWIIYNNIKDCVLTGGVLFGMTQIHWSWSHFHAKVPPPHFREFMCLVYKSNHFSSSLPVATGPKKGTLSFRPTVVPTSIHIFVSCKNVIDTLNFIMAPESVNITTSIARLHTTILFPSWSLQIQVGLLYIILR